MASSGEDVQITCRFVTRLPEKFRIAPTPLAVPGKLTRYGLSEVVNHLLALDPPKPFDFLVDGELVRTSLQKLLLRKAISAEKTLDVEYIPAVGPPSEESVGKHEDWVSAVDGGFAGAIATGCYDGTVKLWSSGGSRLLTVAVPNAQNNAVTSVALLPGDGDAITIVAGAHDGVARTWDASLSKRKPPRDLPGSSWAHRRDRGDRRRARRRALRERVLRTGPRASGAAKAAPSSTSADAETVGAEKEKDETSVKRRKKRRRLTCPAPRPRGRVWTSMTRGTTATALSRRAAPSSCSATTGAA